MYTRSRLCVRILRYSIFLMPWRISSANGWRILSAEGAFWLDTTLLTVERISLDFIFRSPLSLLRRETPSALFTKSRSTGPWLPAGLLDDQLVLLSLGLPSENQVQ